MKSEGECSICELDVNAVFHRVNFNKYIEVALLIQQQSLIKELVSNLIWERKFTNATTIHLWQHIG